ncbi:MobP2 family relaxase [Priestia megaterium]|uniref:MobP2 family relaxase n=1 Tax=Priestia megaterium TaxID=1404 RepID=UPI0013E322B3|nr:MobP2 family relaxase [Priestia megaterium]MED3867135.1 MobP2 family relaxase [Priestia megaterium]MED4146643.1 MobP2 family relaxase [Priestia megaterium]MED4170558.1 MobP2 family relaxase [Priestia megaterium]
MSTPPVTPGVVLKTKFITSDKKAFQDYVDYVDRDDAKKEQEANEKLFTLYQDYMDNPDKTSSLFTQQSNQLNDEEKKQLKKLFEKAQKNNSIMWQDVITFHNPWLQENGLYDADTHTVDEKKLMDITRQSMKEMLKRERLNESAVWSAAIHYNTGNLHIHIATVEPQPTRERGKRKPKTLDAMKSKVVNQILNRGEQQQKINELIRKDMVGKKKQDSSLRWKNRDIQPLFLQIYNHLPEDKRQWQYSYRTLKPMRPFIDVLSQKYIEKYHRNEYQQLLGKLDKEVEELKKAYGEGKVDEKRYKDYKQTKIDDLYKRMGNAFLKEMKDYDKQQQQIKKMVESKKQSKRPASFNQKVSMHFALKKMERAFKSEYDSWKNQQHYERLQKEIEHRHEEERSY